MGNSYFDLLNQASTFPQRHFGLTHDASNLTFHGLDLMDYIDEYGAPLRLTYLPDIHKKIKSTQHLIEQIRAEIHYPGNYHYAYCTKSNMSAQVMRAVLSSTKHIELSSAYDCDIILKLLREDWIDKNAMIICNGYKNPTYISGIQALLQAGLKNVIPILDTMDELLFYEQLDEKPTQLGIRLATEENPDFSIYTSRFGIRPNLVLPFVLERLKDHDTMKLVMLHSFVYTGIDDSAYFWNEFNKTLDLYASLRNEISTLQYLNIGGGFPIQQKLEYEYDQSAIMTDIMRRIMTVCIEEGVKVPDIVTEFGKFTVGESSCYITQIIGVKNQNDREQWYITDGSIMTNIPDIWALQESFLCFPINHWDKQYRRVILGGLTCDNDDFYNGENRLMLPDISITDKPLYVGFFHTGAYQQLLSGQGGVHHCLIPEPKHIYIDRLDDGSNTVCRIEELQSAHTSLSLLGYDV